MEDIEKAYALAQKLSDENRFVVIKDFLNDGEAVFINKRGDMAEISDNKAQFVGHYDPKNGFEDLGYYEERTGKEEPDYWASLKPKKAFVFKKDRIPKLERNRPPPIEIPQPRPVATGLNLTGRAPALMMNAKAPRPPVGPPPAYFKLLYGPPTTH